MKSFDKKIQQPKKEVSCIALSMDFEFLKRNNIDLKKFFSGLPYNYEYLMDENNWIDFETFKEILSRIKKAFGNDPQIMYKAGKSVYDLPGYKFIRTIAFIIHNPVRIYGKVPYFIRKSFSFIDCRVNVKSKTHLTLVYTFKKYMPFVDFCEHVKGILYAIGKVAGFKDIKINYEITKNKVIFNVFLHKKNPIKLLWSFFKRIFFLKKAVEELEESKNLLEFQYNQLEIANKKLKEQLKNLRLLKEFTFASTKYTSTDDFINFLIIFFHNNLKFNRILHFKFDKKERGLFTYFDNGNLLTKNIKGGGWLELSEETLDSLSNIRTLKILQKNNDLSIIDEFSKKFHFIEEIAAIPFYDRIRKAKHIIVIPFLESMDDSRKFEFRSFFEAFYNEISLIFRRILLIEEINFMKSNLEKTVEERTKELKLANERLKNLDRLKDEFILNLTYELRNPFNNILSTLHSLLMDQSEFVREHEEKLKMIYNEAMILLRQINNLLEIQNIKKLNIYFDYKEFRLREILDECVEIASKYCKEKGLELIYEKGSQVFPPVYVDREKFKEAILEILNNAVKFTDPGGKITVSLERENSYQKVIIKDTGKGIPENKQRIIFSIFSKIFDEEQYPGIGVGLTIANSIVKFHGGEIKLKSKLNEGSEFQIIIPEGEDHLLTNLKDRRKHISKDIKFTRRKEDKSGINIRKFIKNIDEISFINIMSKGTNKEFFSKKHTSPHKRSLLLAYPDVNFLTVATEVLEKFFNVYATSDSEKVLQILNEESIDACVLSLNMRRKDNENMIRVLKGNRKTRNIPLIAVSSRIDLDSRMEVLNAGADMYMSVPIDLNELVSHVNVLIEKNQLQRFLEHRMSSLGEEVKALLKKNEELFYGVVESLVNAIDEKDRYTKGHSVRVRKLAVDFSNYLNFDKKFVRDIELASMFHDIGKIGIPDSVLNKPTRLNEKEWELIKLHPVKGVNILSSIPALKGILPLIMSHHERWDGKGYPDGLKKEEIPYGARIIALCDSFDAMSFKRVYRNALTKEQIIEEIMKNKGKQFDPYFATEFIEFIIEKDIKF